MTGLKSGSFNNDLSKENCKVAELISSSTVKSYACPMYPGISVGNKSDSFCSTVKDSIWSPDKFAITDTPVIPSFPFAEADTSNDSLAASGSVPISISVPSEAPSPSVSEFNGSVWFCFTSS